MNGSEVPKVGCKGLRYIRLTASSLNFLDYRTFVRSSFWVIIGSTETSTAILDTPNSPSHEAEERLLEVYRAAAKLIVEKGFGERRWAILPRLCI